MEGKDGRRKGIGKVIMECALIFMLHNIIKLSGVIMA